MKKSREFLAIWVLLVLLCASAAVTAVAYAQYTLSGGGSQSETEQVTGLTAEDKAEILKGLPEDLDESRKQVVLTAYQLLGKVPYFWGGKSRCIGWDPRWGTQAKVTAEGSDTTGTVRPFGLDCSGFVDWVFYNVTNGEYVAGHGGGAMAQHSYCTEIDWSEAQPGDLAFYDDDVHVGIVCGFDENGEILIISSSSVEDTVAVTGKKEYISVARPELYDR